MRHILENCCDNLKRTRKGDQELNEKKLALTSKERQFLLLMNRREPLHIEICVRLLQHINLQGLFSLGLLELVETEVGLVATQNTSKSVRIALRDGINLESLQALALIESR